MSDKIKMTLYVTEEMKAVFHILCTKYKAPQEEVLRKAIALLFAVKKGKENGERPAMIDSTGKVIAELTGI